MGNSYIITSASGYDHDKAGVALWPFLTNPDSSPPRILRQIRTALVFAAAVHAGYQAPRKSPSPRQTPLTAGQAALVAPSLIALSHMRWSRHQHRDAMPRMR